MSTTGAKPSSARTEAREKEERERGGGGQECRGMNEKERRKSRINDVKEEI